MTCKTSAAAGSEYRDSEHDLKYSSADDVDRKTQLAQNKLDTRMESLCLLVTEQNMHLGWINRWQTSLQWCQQNVVIVH